MSMFLKFIALMVVVASAAADVDRGLGKDYEWKTYEEAMAPGNTKPIMLIIHRTWCSACKSLKPVFAEADEIKALSPKFTMVNIDETVDTTELGQWDIDGVYIPRIIFMDSKGVVEKSVINEAGNPSYKYYYHNVDPIVNSMQKALKLLGGNEGGNDTVQPHAEL